MKMAGVKHGWEEFCQAANLLTRLPLPAPAAPTREMLGACLGFAPLVGALVGLLGGGTFWLAAWLGLPPLAGGLMAVAAGFALTGGLHEDGLADVADGFGGGHDRAGKLAIMRDSAIGSYGAAALVFSIGLRTAALAAIADPLAVSLALIAAHSLSRGLLPALMRLLPLARVDGLAAGIGPPPWRAVALAAGLAVAFSVAGLGPGPGALCVTTAVIAALAVSWLARRQIGGYTGDVLGAAQQSSEAAILLTAASLS